MTKKPHALDDTTLAALREQLNQEHGRVSEIIRTIGRDRSSSSANRGPGNAVDEATPKELDDVNDQLLARSRQELVAIEQAITRMDDGTYGVSLRTGEAIPLARLKALPWATDTVAAADDAIRQ